ncbi:MAG TPA: 50S ribosomal protein L13 [Candidatus Caldiarchaeum subterraneum]|uniref:Large ribosomal subunit protein uL13 n=1 Tax=Caldiarchaeum subterraneum TaxID=311458 RepID=A0A832ZTX1_CALS0|nr:50S ribosomal protein L13 [Candidatus Caldarchaeum subterraneum]
MALSEQAQKEAYVVDASGCKVGRLASRVAKLLMQGHRVFVINAEKAVITGNKPAIMSRFHFLRSRKQLTSHKVIKVWYPTLPEGILRYAIIRMLPRKKAKGREAVRRLRVFRGAKQIPGAKPLEIPDAKMEKPISRSRRVFRYMTLEEVSRELRGGRPLE